VEYTITVPKSANEFSLRVRLGQPAFREGPRVDNIIWTWHAVQTALHNPATGQTVLTGARRSGAQAIVSIEDGAAVTLPRYYPQNDHLTPGVALRDGALITVATGHNDGGEDGRRLRLRSALSGRVEDIAYRAQVSVADGTATYAQLIADDGGLYCLTRTGGPRGQNTRWVAYAVLDHDGLAQAAVVIDGPSQCYLAARPGGVLAWTHPRHNTPTQGHIYRFAWAPGDPTRDIDAMSPVYEPTAGRSARVLDVSEDATRALIVEFDADAPWPADTAEYVLLSGLDGVVTETRTGVAPGLDLWETYFLGGCIDPTDGALWLCHRDGSGYALTRWTPDGAAVVLTDNAPLARPLSTLGPVACAVQRLEGYSHFRTWDRADARTVLRG
jgi:hypothetical protein